MKKLDFLQLKIEENAFIKVTAITGIKFELTSFSGIFLGFFNMKVRIGLHNHHLKSTDIPYHRINKIEILDELPEYSTRIL